jgi:hypothetical protein
MLQLQQPFMLPSPSTAACLAKKPGSAERSSQPASSVLTAASHYPQALVRPNMMMVQFAGESNAAGEAAGPPALGPGGRRSPALLTHTGHAGTLGMPGRTTLLTQHVATLPATQLRGMRQQQPCRPASAELQVADGAARYSTVTLL